MHAARKVRASPSKLTGGSYQRSSVRIPHSPVVRGDPEQERDPEAECFGCSLTFMPDLVCRRARFFLLFPIKKSPQYYWYWRLALQWFVKQCVHCCPGQIGGLASSLRLAS